MSNGIELFDSKGRMLPLDQIESQLATPELQERFAAVRAAHAALAEVEADLLAVNEAIKEAMAAVVQAENVAKLAHPPRTFLDEWRAHKATRAQE